MKLHDQGSVMRVISAAAPPSDAFDCKPTRGIDMGGLAVFLIEQRQKRKRLHEVRRDPQAQQIAVTAELIDRPQPQFSRGTCAVGVSETGSRSRSDPRRGAPINWICGPE